MGGGKKKREKVEKAKKHAKYLREKKQKMKVKLQAAVKGKKKK